MPVIMTMQDKAAFEKVGEIFNQYRQTLAVQIPAPARDAYALALTQAFFTARLADAVSASSALKVNGE